VADRKRFPLFRHSSGQWCKKIGGKHYYFGTDQDEALRRYAAELDGIRAGRPRTPPPADTPAGMSVKYLCDSFLASRRTRVEAGELAEGSWRNYYRVCVQVADTLGRGTPVLSLTPADFGRLRTALSAGLGPGTATHRLAQARTLFKHAETLTDQPVRVRDQLSPPPLRVRRLHRQRQGPRLLDASDLRRVIEAADPVLRAATLLGLNCGFGAQDCSDLTLADLDRRPGWVELPRRKTGLPRRCPLWPETVAALAAVRATRHRPAAGVPADRVFLSAGGRELVRDTGGPGRPGRQSDLLGPAWQRLCGRLGVELPKGSGLYVLRRIFRTVADEVRDDRAVAVIMGHARSDMAASYIERIEDDRLERVTANVRSWLGFA
jgi:integrase